MRILGAVLLLVGCGPNFNGVWFGELTTTSSCGGAPDVLRASATWSIIDRNASLTVTPERGTCGSFAADAMGNVATFRPKTCEGVSLTGGYLRLQGGDKLNVSMSFSNGGQCSGTSAGDMWLQK